MGSDPRNLLLAARIVIDEAHCITQLGRDYRYFRLSVLQIPRACLITAHFSALITGNWPTFVSSAQACRFSRFLQPVVTMYFATSLRSSVFRLSLTVQVRTVPPSFPPYYRSTLTGSPSCRSARHSALPKPALPQEPALQGAPEVLGPYSRCAGNGQVHTRAPPERDWDRVLSLARSKNYPFRVPVADITFLV